MRDGADAGQKDCLVCFQKGKDIQLATGENVCGPLCGYQRPVLAQFSVWSNATAQAPQVAALAHANPLAHAALMAKHVERVRFLNARQRDRPNVLFYGGNIYPERGPHPRP